MTAHTDTNRRAWYSLCETCGKRCYPTRKAAKHAARSIPRNGNRRMSAYQCGDAWHLGHLPVQIKIGKATRSDLGSNS